MTGICEDNREESHQIAPAQANANLNMETTNPLPANYNLYQLWAKIEIFFFLSHWRIKQDAEWVRSVVQKSRA